MDERDVWEPEFDVYRCNLVGKPAVFVVDLAAGPRAPVASHPLRLQVRVAMQVPREDGLRDERESEALHGVEDRLVPDLEALLDAIYVGRFVSDGFTTFVFYLPAFQEGRDLGASLPDLYPYEPEWLTEDDPEWACYREFLAPDAVSLQSIMNRRLLESFTKDGDDLETPREVDHLASFPSPEQAAAASDALRTKGFRVDPPSAREARWTLEFHRDERLADDRPDEFTTEILGVLEAHAGEYDGWGAVVMRSDGPPAGEGPARRGKATGGSRRRAKASSAPRQATARRSPRAKASTKPTSTKPASKATSPKAKSPKAKSPRDPKAKSPKAKSPKAKSPKAKSPKGPKARRPR